jgi:MFS family permease
VAADLPADVAGLPLRLHPDGFDRPAPTAPPVLLAAAGLLAFVGVGALLSEVFDDERALAIVLGGLGLAGAIVLAILGGPRFVTAASAIAGVAVIAFIGGLLGDWLGEEPGPYLLLLALAELVLFLAVPGLRGRPFLLALALALLALGLAALVADDRFQGVSDDVAEGTAFEVDDPLGLSPSVSRGATTLLVVGGAYLGAAFLLDRRQHRRLATPFVAIGAAAAVLGATHRTRRW